MADATLKDDDADAESPSSMSPRRREAFQELNAAGWPSVADDVHDELPAATILGRLDEIAQPESDAYEIVSRLADDEANQEEGS